VRLAIQARPWPKATAEYRLRLSAFRLRHFLSFFAFVIRAEAALAHASTGILRLQLSMNHRIKSVVTLSESGFP
jgi:hypothetical protein